jgi:pimeloyl-ACP methyl ester carboxylesterase
LVHATGLHAHVFLPLMEHLRSAVHCYAFDLPGHGSSETPPDGDFDWRHFADDALAVCECFGIERPFGFGHSCGGAVLLLAEQAHAGSWRQLYTYEPIVPEPGMFASPGNPMSAAALRRRTDFPSRQAAYDNFASKPPLDVLTPDALWAYVEYGFTDQPDGSVTLACRPESEAQTFATATTHAAWDHLAAVRCPVVVACGEVTDTFGSSHFEAVAGRLRDGRAEVMPGLSHFGPLERPAEVAAAVFRTFGGAERPIG